MWIDDAQYIVSVSIIVKELKTLNDVLRSQRNSKKRPTPIVDSVSKHFNSFLKSYASALGKGLAVLTVRAMAELLYHAGVGTGNIDSIWGHLKLPK